MDITVKVCYNKSTKFRRCITINKDVVMESCRTCAYKETNTGESGCQKVGSIGYCGDVEENEAKKTSPVKKASYKPHGVAYQRHKNNVKKKRLIEVINANGYAPHIGSIKESKRLDKKGNPKGNYIVYPKNSKYQKFLKRLTSKRSRREFDLPTKGNKYRRTVDFWWELY